MIETQKYIRKPLYVDAVRITNANFEEIAAWCQGEIGQDERGKKCIKVRVHNPKNVRQTQAGVGDWLLYTERGYKVYTNKAFHASFDQVEGVQTPPTAIEQVNIQSVGPVAEEPNQETGVQPISEMAQAVETIESEGGTIEEATPEGIADAVAQNEQAQMAEGKTVITLEEQAEMDQDEIRELLKSGEYILAQDLAA